MTLLVAIGWMVGCASDRKVHEQPPQREQAPAVAEVEAPPQAAPVDRGFALPVWRALLESGCKLGPEGPIWTPFEARVLEAVPLAERGWDFEESDLRAYFSKDGTWYTPVSGLREVVLRPEEQACVDRVKARRVQLADIRPIPDAFLRSMLEYPVVMSDFWRLALHDQDPYRNVRVTQEGSAWIFRADLPCSKESFECHYLEVRCDPVEPSFWGTCWGGQDVKE